MTKQIGNPELLETWASEGDTSEPFLSKRRQGWLFQEQPASALMNWVQNEQQQKINHLLKNGVSEWSPNTDYTRGACVKHANTAWKARRDNVESEPAQGNRDWTEIEPLPIIRAPDLISPIDGASDVATAAPLVASEYAPVYSVDDRDYRRFQVDVAGGDFSDPIRTNDVNADTWTVDPVLETSGGFIWRCRDVSVRGDESPWSDIESFTTGEVFVTQPSITAPSNNATGVTEAPTLTSSAFAVTGGSDAHVASYWRVFMAGALVFESGRNTNALTAITLPDGILVDGETTYTVQVRHEGAAFGLSAWSAASTFTTLDIFSRVQTPAITSPLAGETGILETPTFTSGAFVVINGSDTHRASFWEVYTAADALVWSSGRSFTNRTSITLPQAILQDGQTGYKVRVRHEGTSLGLSDWSPTVNFTTASTFGRLFSGAVDTTVRGINASGLNQRSVFSSQIGTINCLAYENGFVYSGSSDGSIRKLAEESFSASASYLGTGPVSDICVGGDDFVYAGAANFVRKLNASNLSLVSSVQVGGFAFSITFGGDGKIYAGDQERKINKINPSTMEIEAQFQANNRVLSLCFGTDGFLYGGGANGELHKLDPSDMSLALPVRFTQRSSLFAVAFGTDGFLYVGSNSRFVDKISVSDLSTVNTFSGHTNTVHALAFGSDGFLYSGGADNAVRKIDVSDMTQAGLFSGNTSEVRSLAYNVSINDLLGFPL